LRAYPVHAEGKGKTAIYNGDVLNQVKYLMKVIYFSTVWGSRFSDLITRSQRQGVYGSLQAFLLAFTLQERQGIYDKYGHFQARLGLSIFTYVE
jgi:hypothetical protein